MPDINVKYPVLKSGLELHATANVGYILRQVDGYLGKNKKFSSHDKFEAEGYLIDYLALCNGVTSNESLAKTFISRHGIGFGPTLLDLAERISLTNDFIEILDVAMADPRQIRFTGSREGFHPLHLTFEIIETCNFTCDHCYYSSSPFKTGRISLAEAIQVMDKAAERGVRIIELTGGECTIHPDFREILDHASRKFDMVAIISNGYKLGSEQDLADFVSTFPNVIVQISIDGVEEWHNRFRKHPRAFKNAVKAIQRLVAADVPVRMASIITNESVDQILPLYQLGKSLGVLQVAFAPIADIGRGCNITDPGVGSRRLVNIINKTLHPYIADPLLQHEPAGAAGEKRSAPRNCGAGWRTFTVDYDGNVRACNFSRDSKKFGNVIKEDYSLLFEQEANFLFHNAMIPGGAECQGCDYYHHCRGCFVKAFMTSQNHYPECPWREKWFPKMSLELEDDREKKLPVSDQFRALPTRSYGLEFCDSCTSKSSEASHHINTSCGCGSGCDTNARSDTNKNNFIPIESLQKSLK